MLTNPIDRIELERVYSACRARGIISAKRIVKSDQDALECLQDAFLDVLQNAHDARNLEALWLRQVKNRALDMLRTRRVSIKTMERYDTEVFDADPASIATRTANWLLRTLKGEQAQVARMLLACNGHVATAADRLAMSERQVYAAISQIRARYQGYRMPNSKTFKGGASYLSGPQSRTVWPLLALYEAMNSPIDYEPS